MPSRRLLVSSLDVSVPVDIIGDASFIEAATNHRFWQEFIPGCTLNCFTGTFTSGWTVALAKKNSYSISSKMITLESEDYIQQAIVIIESVLEMQRQNKEMYTMHGSLIAYSGAAVGLIGGVSGLGKTTVAAYASTQGLNWVADEKFTLQGNNVVAGVSGTLNDHKTKQSSRGRMPNTSLLPLPLKLLLIPVLTSEPAATLYEYNLQKAEWQIYDEMTRDISQINGRLNGFEFPLRSLDSDELARNRSAYSAYTAGGVPVVSIRGNESAILKTIINRLDDHINKR